MFILTSRWPGVPNEVVSDCMTYIVFNDMAISNVNTFFFCIMFYRFVYIWDTTSRRILYKLPGHAGSVNEVVFHPEEPIGEWTNFIG